MPVRRHNNTGYAQGCRCDTCRTARRLYQRAARERQPETRQSETPFSPTCPRCQELQDHDAIRCAVCDVRLYPSWSGRYD